MSFDNTNFVEREVVSSPELELLKDGREKIAAEWCQKVYHTYDGREVCMVGALLTATQHRKRFMHEVYAQALYYLRKATGSTSIPKWNDNPKRTHQEVIDAYDRAIHLASIDAKRCYKQSKAEAQ